ncbi:MAG: hypothetical protein IJQ21_09300 [Lachnospiraceae bacterium]|nr:hypothetical protein [Lachnospiraceae bacterium]
MPRKKANNITARTPAGKKPTTTVKQVPTIKSKRGARRTLKDSVFTDLFKDKKNLLQLYWVLHPEDKDATEDDLTDVTIKNVMVENIYNDLGFIVRDRLMILVEAQTVFTVNILVRVLMYLMQSYFEYFKRTEQNYYGTKKVKMPEPELYVICTADRKRKPKYISLSKEFFGGKEIAIDAKVRMIYDSKQGDIINQYVTFTKVFDTQRKKYGYTRKAVEETIRICKNKNVLKEYLQSREKEVIDIMMVLYDQDEVVEMYGRSKRREGEIKGTIETLQSVGMSMKDAISQIAGKFDLPEKEAKTEVSQYWKKSARSRRS